ncbi:hypothetical protein F4781DRAFT_65339 [Annulohypoxylon bovei var. microspora]|nr:hypothetical protein F4781DRAFT_65339 [Annulohypoxylon bovei var. microspora]
MATTLLEIKLPKSNPYHPPSSLYYLSLDCPKEAASFCLKKRLLSSNYNLLPVDGEARLRGGQEKKGSRSQRKACLAPPSRRSREERGGSGDDRHGDEHSQDHSNGGDSSGNGKSRDDPGDNRDDGPNDGGDDERDDRWGLYAIERSEDDHDMEMASLPIHIDCLSPGHKEEDIWSSWKYITARRGVYSSSIRLENALWRAWMQSKRKLATVTPESLNWDKDCDVTWLYGPLPTSKTPAIPQETIADSTLVSARQPINNKAILKSRLVLEIERLRDFSRHLKGRAAPIDQGQCLEPFYARTLGGLLCRGDFFRVLIEI